MNLTQRPLEPQETIPLSGLSMAPAQVLGGVRLVPLLRESTVGDLRLLRRRYDDDMAEVRIDSRTSYYSYVPHALVASWTKDESPVAAYGTQMRRRRREPENERRVLDYGFATARVLNRMRRREAKDRLRFLPMHLSMEGFLSLHFGGPNIAWEEYSRRAFSDGLSPRSETNIPGRCIVGLDDALRVFEIRERQVGTLVFVGDALASAFVTPHPEDYRALHETLLTDFYGELLYSYGVYAQENEIHPPPIDPASVNSFDALRQQLHQLSLGYCELHQLMSDGLFACPVRTEPVYKMGPFQMSRFITRLDPKSENHIGEMITRSDGSLEYLKTFRLSAAQCRRAYLLMQLARVGWDLAACAQSQNCTKNQLIYRLENAGFGYLLHPHILEAARVAAEAR